MIQRALVFPGQGSQTVGMGKELSENFVEAKEVFQEVDDVLGQHLSKIIFEGPQETLTLTENAQPALMAVSLAVWRVLQKQGKLDLNKIAGFVAGHSLGEYSALTAAGTFSLADSARLLRIRGNAMQAAVPVGQGSMAAVIGLEIDAAEAVAKEVIQALGGNAVCDVANDNSSGQVVLSGTVAAIDAAEAIAKAKGAKRFLKLPVSAPFHCSLMKPAAEKMQQALAGVSMRAPMVPVVANIIAEATSDPKQIGELLVQQVTGRVRWRESMIYLAGKGVTQVVEVGAGKVLAGLAKRSVDTLEAISICAPAEIEAFVLKL